MLTGEVNSLVLWFLNSCLQIQINSNKLHKSLFKKISVCMATTRVPRLTRRRTRPGATSQPLLASIAL